MEEWPVKAQDQLQVILALAQDPPVGRDRESALQRVAKALNETYGTRSITPAIVHRFMSFLYDMPALEHVVNPLSSHPLVSCSTHASMPSTSS